MAYTPDPTDVTNPLDTVDASTAAAEFRALKGYLSTLVGGGGFPGVNVFRKNAIIGGDFDTNPFQRGTNFVAVVSGQYVADRWQYSKVGTMVETVDKGEAPVLGTVYKNKTMDMLANNGLRCNVTTAEAILGAGDFAMVLQVVEGYNFKLFAQIPMVLSFWHAHTKVGTYCVAFRNSISDRSYIAEYQQVVSDAFEFDQIVVPASPSGGTWNYVNGAGLSVAFTKGAGATFQTPAGIWTNGNFLASANQINSLDTIGNKFRIDIIQLESASIASKFERRSIQEELLLCQRYFEKSFFINDTPVQNKGIATGEVFFPAIKAGALGELSSRIPFRVLKRTTSPGITLFNPSAANAQVRDTSAAVDCTATNAADNSDSGFSVVCTGNAATLVGNTLAIHWTADSEL